MHQSQMQLLTCVSIKKWVSFSSCQKGVILFHVTLHLSGGILVSETHQVATTTIVVAFKTLDLHFFMDKVHKKMLFSSISLEHSTT
jgi:hypothetical protein